MALARKCDRCGRLYEHYPASNKSGIWNGVRLTKKSVNNFETTSTTDMDLCCYCMNDLQKFLQNANMTVVEEKEHDKS